MKMNTRLFLSLAFLNALLATFLCVSYIPKTILFWSFQNASFSFLASFSHFLLLFLLIGLPSYLLLLVLRNNNKIALGLLVLSNTILSFTIYLNFRIYELYKFHLNGMVLELITGGALQDNISFDLLVWFLFIVIALALILAQIFISLLVYKAIKKIEHVKLYSFILLLVFLASSIISQSIYMLADAKGDTNITSIKRFIPWAQTVTAKRNLKALGVEVNETNAPSLNSNAGTLNYPIQTIECTPAQKPNILLVIVDSLRFDMLEKDIMPKAYEFGQSAHVYTNHYSVSNSTRFGIFSLMYGLPGSYWQDLLNTQTSPVFLDTLMELDYEFYINSAAPLFSPEFDRTVFSKLKEKINIGPKNTASFKKDEFVLSNFTKQIQAHRKNQAFFGFLFFDSPHSYSYPDTWEESFLPSWAKINYLELNAEFEAEKFLNRYKNSVAYTDSLVGKVIKNLKEADLDENTIIIFTSDHGQEFNETGLNFWGHNGNFSDHQTKVPLIIKWPEASGLSNAQVINNQTMSVDIVPSLMSNALNCSNPINDYSTGLNLYDANNNYQRPMLMDSWSKRAIVGEDYIFVSHDINGTDIYDRSYKPKKDFSVPPKDLNQAFKEMSMFR